MNSAIRSHQVKLEESMKDMKETNHDIKVENNRSHEESMKELKAEFKEELKAVKSLIDHINGK